VAHRRDVLASADFSQSAPAAADAFCELRKVMGISKLINSSAASLFEDPERIRRLCLRSFKQAALARLRCTAAVPFSNWTSLSSRGGRRRSIKLDHDRDADRGAQKHDDRFRDAQNVT